MIECPILLNATAVRAIRAGTKTQHRVAMKPQPADDIRPHRAPNKSIQCWISSLAHQHGTSTVHVCPYGQAGDRIWVRESWAVGKCADSLKPIMLHPGTWMVDNGGLWYPADAAEPRNPISPRGKTRPGMYMPRWASRIVLDVTEVRVQRLQDISEADAWCEGVDASEALSMGCSDGAVAVYSALWEKNNGADSWDANPWVWAVEFRRIEP